MTENMKTPEQTEESKRLTEVVNELFASALTGKRQKVTNEFLLTQIEKGVHEARTHEDGAKRHEIAKAAMNRAHELVPEAVQKALTLVIVGDLRKNFAEPEPNEDLVHKMAMISISVNSLVEEARQIGHRLAPSYGGNLASKVLDVAETVMNDLEHNLAHQILKAVEVKPDGKDEAPKS